MRNNFFTLSLAVVLLFIFGSSAYSQNFGIGTTTPTQKLDVDGGLRLRNFSNTLFYADGTGVVNSLSLTPELNFGGGTLGIAAQGAATGQVLEWNGTNWVPALDDNTTYSAGPGLGLSGTTFELDAQTSGPVVGNGTPGNAITFDESSASNNDVWQYDGANWVLTDATTFGDDWGTQVANTSGPVVGDGAGTAISFLDGTADNQVWQWDNATSSWQLNTVTTTVATDAPITGDGTSGAPVDLQNGSAAGQNLVWDGSAWTLETLQTTAELEGLGTASDPVGINQQGASANQVLKWNGSSWAPGTDANTTYSAGTGINITAGNVIENTGDLDPTDDYNTSATLNGTDLEIVDNNSTVVADLSALNDNTDADADPTNEYNSNFQLNGTDLDITDGGGTLTADLSSLSGTDDQDITITGPDAAGDVTASMENGNSQTFSINDDDADPTNEYNSGASFSGNTLTVTDGGGPVTADLSALRQTATGLPITGDGTSGNPVTFEPGTMAGQVWQYNGSNWQLSMISGGDNWGSQVVQSDATLTGDGTGSNQLGIAQQGASANQVLEWNGSSWAPAQDNVDDADAVIGNEYQDLNNTVSGTDVQVEINNGTNTTLTGVYNTNMSFSSNTLTVSDGGPGVSVDLSALDNNTDADADPNNEIQNLDNTISGKDVEVEIDQGGTNTTLTEVYNVSATLNGTDLEIDDGGGTVIADLSSLSGGDNWGSQVVQSDATLTGDGTGSNQLGIAQQGAGGGDVLKWNGTSWAPAADDNTTYSAGAGINITGGNVIENTGDLDPTDDYNTSATLNGTDLEIVDNNSTVVADLSALDDNTDADADPTNEYNTNVQLNGTDLEVTDGGGTLTQDLSSINTDNQDITITGPNPAGDVTASMENANSQTFSINDDDADPTNEYNNFMNFNASTNILTVNDGAGDETADLSTLASSGSDNDWTGAGSGDMYATNTGDNVGIGTNSPSAYLNVEAGNQEEVARFNRSGNNGNNIHNAVAISSTGHNDGGRYRALRVTARSSTPCATFGCGRSWGVYARAGNATEGFNASVYGQMRGSTGGAAIFGNEASSMPGSGTATSGSTGIIAGYFNGRVESNDGFYSVSDRRLKKNVRPIQSSLDKVMGVNAYSYQYRDMSHEGLALGDGKQFGFITQEVEKVMPRLVSGGDSNYAMLNYDQFIPVLAGAIQEQQDQHLTQEEQIQALQAQVDQLNQKLEQKQTQLKSVKQEMQTMQQRFEARLQRIERTVGTQAKAD